MSDQELVEAVIPDATVLLEDTSQRTRRALRRCGGKLSGLAPLATERLKEQSLPEQLYTNVVGLIASEMGREDTASGEPVPLSFVGEGKGATAVEIISDLLTTVEAVLAVKARAEVLLELLEKEGDPEVYRSLATSLEPLMKQILDFGFPALAASIVATFQNHLSEPSGPDWRKRRAALALEHMRQTSTLSKVEADLEKATAAEAGPLVFLLCLFGRVGAVRLAGILSDDKQAGLHEAAAEGLANLASEIGDLLPQLTASMPWTASARLAARMATLGDEGALRQVATILKHRDWRVRRAVVEALGEARGRAIDLLIQALGDKDRDVRAVALEHLANIREPASVPALLAMATHGKVGGEDHALRQRAVAALGKIGDPAVPALERILVRRAWIRRKAQEKLSAAAADALAQIGGEQAHAALEHGAASAGGPVQSACVKALATAGSAVSRALERDV
jgi:HEAT repeat protein